VTVADAKRAVAPLVDLLVDGERAADLNRRALDWPNWYLSRRQLCDLELLACGGFTPLESFLGEQDYESVCASMRLADGTLWPVPVTLDVPEDVLAAGQQTGTLALREPEGTMVAALDSVKSTTNGVGPSTTLSSCQRVWGTDGSCSRRAT